MGFVDRVSRQRGNFVKPGSPCKACEFIPVETEMEHTGILGVKTAIFGFKVSERNKAAFIEHGIKFAYHRLDILHMMHRHR